MSTEVGYSQSKIVTQRIDKCTKQTKGSSVEELTLGARYG